MKTFNEFLTMTAGVPAISSGSIAAMVAAYRDGRMTHGPLSARRAVWFCRLAQDPTVSRRLRADAREVLADCARVNGRDQAINPKNGRPVLCRIERASTVRLAYWAMDKGAIW